MRCLLACAACALLAGPVLAQGLPSRVKPEWIPEINPFTLAKSKLGKALFWDEQLSSSQTVSCGTCHILEDGGVDPRSRLNPTASTHPGLNEEFGDDDDIIGSQGVIKSNNLGYYLDDPLFGLNPQVTRRNAPSVINAVLTAQENVPLGWGGAASTEFKDPLTGLTLIAERGALESQSVRPFLNAVEMGHEGKTWADLTSAMANMKPLALSPNPGAVLEEFIGIKTYTQLFNEVFGDSLGVTPARIGFALATYQRTLVADKAPVHTGGLGPETKLGADMFDHPKQCGKCHIGFGFTNHTFQRIFLTPIEEDIGRGESSDDPEERGKFREPDLINVDVKGRNGHDGSLATLEDVVDHYNTGPGSVLFEQPLGLGPETAARASILAYMRGFTDPRVVAGEAPFDRPVLYTESERVPVLVGVPTPRGEIEPRMVAVEPPSITNANFTLGVHKAIGGGLAVLMLSPDLVAEGTMIYGVKSFLNPQSMTQAGVVVLEGTGAGKGFASFHFDLTVITPSETPVYAQWFILDPGDELPLASSATEAVCFVVK